MIGADILRFEPHLGHNWLSCGVFLVKSRNLMLPLAQTIMGKLAISLSGWLGRYTNVEYLQSLYLKRPGKLLFLCRPTTNFSCLDLDKYFKLQFTKRNCSFHMDFAERLKQRKIYTEVTMYDISLI